MSAAVKVADQQPGAGHQGKDQIVKRGQDAFVSFNNIAVDFRRSQAGIAAGVQQFPKCFFPGAGFFFLGFVLTAEIYRITVKRE